MLQNSKQFLLHMSHLSCYSCHEWGKTIWQ
jgi:hypothetical protein